MIFRDRIEAGRRLANRLAKYTGRRDVVVLGLPRGGVPIAFEVARALDVPLDVFLVRKLGVPGYEELAMGAIASGGIRVRNEAVIRRLKVTEEAIETVTESEQRELERREQAFRGDRPTLDLHGRTVILVDDGLATGATIRAAVEAIREQHPAWVIVAVPVGAPETCHELRSLADDVICAVTPEPFYAVGQWYHDFSQTTDDEVRQLLERARREHEPNDHLVPSSQ